MAIRYSYTATDVVKIAATLGQVFASMEQDGQVTRFATNNLLISVASDEAMEKVEEVVDLLSIVHPSRFFVINTASKSGLKAEVSARCQMIGKNEHVCSEVVRIHVGSEDYKSVPSLLFANLVTGVPTEFLIYDPATPRELIDALTQVSETLYFDSGDFEASPELIYHLSSSRASLVDLQWVKLSPWREQVRVAFERANVSQQIKNINKITVRTEASAELLTPAPTRLLCGWLLSKLGLEVRKSPRGILGFKRDGGEVAFDLQTIPAKGQSEIRELEIAFKSDGAAQRQLRFLKGKNLETYFELERPTKQVVALEPDDSLSRLKRYFTIGESITNYPSALKRSLALEKLSQNNR